MGFWHHGGVLDEGCGFMSNQLRFTALFTFLWKRDLDFFACLVIT